jgi:uncharacterized membrane-anchored protein
MTGKTDRAVRFSLSAAEGIAVPGRENNTDIMKTGVLSWTESDS